jgi:hypothetical protein
MEYIDMAEQQASKQASCDERDSSIFADHRCETAPAKIGTVPRTPGTCVPWEEKQKEFARIAGDEAIVKRVWEDVDGLGYMYIWQILLSF